MSRLMKNDGFSLVEVMVAMVIAGVALMGTLSAVEISSRHIRQGGLSGKAVELAQSRLEAKRSVRWESLLEDDLDHDGIPETIMADDGQHSDITAGDGIYTAMYEREGVTVVWMIETNHPGPLSSTAMVMIQASGSYVGPNGQKKEVKVATIRANPNFVGQR